MKVFAVLCLLLCLVAAEKCPAKLLNIATKNVKAYLKGVFKKVGTVKLNCKYDHDSNVFNLEHHVRAETTYKKRKLSMEMRAHSSMFDLYNFTDFNGQICHSKMRELKDAKDRKLIKDLFMKKYAKSVTDKDIKRVEKNGQVCYKAVMQKKKALVRKHIL